MRSHCEMIKKQVNANFVNLETAIRTYDREASVCGSPAWRYVFHTIHSADKWFFNPSEYEERDFYESGMDNPDNPCRTVLSDEDLLRYLDTVRQRTFDYLDSLSDDDLYRYPENCEFSRLELIMMQFRHISFHTGMLNGATIERTGRFPVFVSPHSMSWLDKGLYDE